MPGQVAVLWGSGVGADTGNNDRTYPLTQNNLTNIPLQVFVGGISANVLYQGRSQYPGVDQIDIAIPTSVTPGCFVSVVAMIGSIVSNTVTIPVDPGGAVCSDATPPPDSPAPRFKPSQIKGVGTSKPWASP